MRSLTNIFKDKNSLSSSYIPQHLPERENEITELQYELSAALRGDIPNNIFIYGKTGVGKTACARKVIHQLNTKTEEENIKNIRTIYLNCATTPTECQILTEIANFFSTKKLAPTRGWGAKEYYNFFAQTLNQLSGIFIIVLDEIDKLLPEGKNFLYNLSGANEHLLSNAKISIIGISNDLKFTEKLDSRITSRLCEREMIIPPYNSNQLQKILKQRSSIAFHKNTIDDGVISLCAALSAQEHGDARKALDLLRMAGEIAQREESMKVTETYVRKAQNFFELDRVNEIIRTLPVQSKLLLSSILELSTNHNAHLTTGEVYGTYRDMATKINMGFVSQRRATDLISELDMLGIINARVISYGRGGRTREITPAVPVHDTKELLLQDDSLSSLRDYKTPCPGRSRKGFF